MNGQGDETPALSIGAMLGDSNAENMAWSRAIGELSKRVISARDGVSSPLRLNVVYFVDGKLSPNDFEGVRTGRFSKKDAHLVVQAAVPLNESSERRAVLAVLLECALSEAEIFARKKGLADALPELRSLVRASV